MVKHGLDRVLNGFGPLVPSSQSQPSILSQMVRDADT